MPIDEGGTDEGAWDDQGDFNQSGPTGEPTELETFTQDAVLGNAGTKSGQGVGTRYSHPARLGPHMLLQAGQGHRAAVIELRPGLYLVAEVPEQVTKPEFGLVASLAPLLVNAAAKALVNHALEPASRQSQALQPAPAMQAVPAQSVAQVQPVMPAQPVAPVQPVMPAQPVAPVQPVAQWQSFMPSQSLTSNQSAMPAQAVSKPNTGQALAQLAQQGIQAWQSWFDRDDGSEEDSVSPLRWADEGELAGMGLVPASVYRRWP